MNFPNSFQRVYTRCKVNSEKKYTKYKHLLKKDQINSLKKTQLLKISTYYIK